MSEHVPGMQPGELPSPSAGALLRQAREASGLHVAALAVAMKVPVKKLEALEADRYQDLPDTTFTRALAASVCRTLKVDATPILERLPQGQKPALKRDDSNINAPFRGSRAAAGPSMIENLPKPTVLLVGLLLLGALAITLMPSLPSVSDWLSNTNTTAQVAPEPAAVPSSETATPPGAVSATDPASTPVSLVQSQSLESAAPAASAGLVATNMSGLDPANALVVFKAGSGDSWVQVTDAKGKNILRRNVSPGEVVGAGGTPPLSVVVGRADSIAVTVRGQAFDLSAHARDNVAKFEVR